MNEMLQYIAPSRTSTPSPVLIAGLAAAALSGASVDHWQAANTRSYATRQMQSTYSSVAKHIKLSTPPMTSDFNSKLTSIFTSLLASQEPLGSEFEAVWDAHLDQLYED
jgi:hypothetical protein